MHDMKLNVLFGVLVVAGLAAAGLAHDSWLQINTNLVRVGDRVHVDLMLGNHGNDHRDFKVAGKVALDKATWEVIDPDGKHFDLKPDAVDEGYAAKEGYWTSGFSAAKPGMYMVAETSDQVVSYAPLRSVHSAKTFFLATKSLDKPDVTAGGYDRVLGHALELIPTSNPVVPMGPGEKLGVRLLFKGKPAAGVKVSFIPRGVTLKEGFDERYEKTTDAKGEAAIELKDANYYLIAAHVLAEKEAGTGYQGTKYSATLCVYVPAICPCCGE
jgi:uncharacterized GH25 family protein